MNKEKEGKAKIVGIFGMGGVGKTTLSKESFNRKRQQYARACFLFDVREASGRCNLPSLQMKLLKDLFDKEDVSFQSKEEGSSCISDCVERSTSLNFLLVLDDVDHMEQLDALSIRHILEKPGNSLVIITTRDVGILIAEGINIGYHLKRMDKDDARQLFSWHAFSQSHPASRYEDLVDDFLGVCGGLPLSLQVLGRHVHGRDENYWRSELQKLGRTMHRDIRKSLKISFDALNTEEKQIFMDMACFFVDQLKCIAIGVWKASGWSAQNGLQALKDKCLVEEIEDPVPILRMHDHLRDLGREMANEFSHPRRLWHPRDLKELESKGFENIFAQTKGRCLHSIFDKSLNVEVKFFLGESDDNAEMSSCLLWLHLLYPYYSRPYSSNLNHPRHPHQLSFSVQPTIPSWILLQNMQCLRISNGCFNRLWQQDAEAPSQMKQLEICGTLLEEYPDFLGVLTNVEKEVKKDVNKVQHMSKMKSLMVKTCRRLSGSLPPNSANKSTFKIPLNGARKSATAKTPLSLLEDLIIKEQENIKRIVLNGNYCPNLQSLELYSVRNLIEVQFTRVETLNCLNIVKCGYLKILSVTSDLTELEELNVSACPMLEEPNLGHLSSLKKIRIADCNMNSVPGMSSFKMLVELNVSRCPNLHELCLAHLSWLEKLTVHYCDHLKSVTGVSRLLNLVEVSISWCWMLQLDLCLAGLNRLKSITFDRSVKMKCFELSDCKDLETVSGISFEMIREVNICGCPELKNLPVICGPSRLEQIIINGCGRLNYLKMTDCRVLKNISGTFDLVGLSISDCPMLQELPSLGRVIYLEEIRVLKCRNLKNMTLPTTLKRLELNACRELKNIPAISTLTELEELNITDFSEPELYVADLIWLKKIAVANLKSLPGISNLTKLVELEIFQCVEFQVELSLSGLCCLKRIVIVECGKMRRITLPTNLTKLTLEACRDLETVIGISGLTKLVELNIKRCPKLPLELNLASLNHLERFTIVECWSVYNITLPIILIERTPQQSMKLQIKAGMGHLTKLTELHISECPLIEEMPVVCGLSCLERITIDGCGNFNRLHVIDCATLKVVRGNFDFGHLTHLWISDCPEFRELPCFARLTCLEKIQIFRCRKLNKLTLPRTLKNLQLDSCNELKSVSRMSGLKNLVELIISQCEQLELELRLEDMNSLQSITFDHCGKLEDFLLNKCQNLKSVSGNFDVERLFICDCPELEQLFVHDCPGLRCLETILIESCDKLQNITLPTKFTHLIVQRCRRLQRIAGRDDLKELTHLCITKCPELEELPTLDGMSCLKFEIDSCEKLHKITLPSTLIKLTVRRWRGSQMLSALIDNLTKLEDLSICECPEVEELPSFAKLSNLKMIAINSCEKLHNITLPTTVIELTVQGCRELHRVAISERPKVGELPILARMYCLKSISIDSCEKLENIEGTEELQELEAIQFLYCSNAGIQNCITKLKRMPSAFIQVVGRAANGAQSNLNPFSLSEAYLCHSDDWQSVSAMIMCCVVVVTSSTPFHTINESLKHFMCKFNLRQGGWIITTITSSQTIYRRLDREFSDLRKQGIMMKWSAWGVKKGEDWRIFHALTTIINKLHQK